MHVQQGELERFCAAAHPRLVAALAHHFGDRWLAEELAQEALERACDRWSSVRRLDSPTGWAFRVGVNLGNSRFRRRAAERRARARHGPEGDRHDDPDVGDRVAVWHALGRLTDRQREVVLLRYFLGLSAAGAAALTGSTEGAVRTLTHRALTTLRTVLGDVRVSEEVSDAS